MRNHCSALFQQSTGPQTVMVLTPVQFRSSSSPDTINQGSSWVSYAAFQVFLGGLSLWSLFLREVFPMGRGFLTCLKSPLLKPRLCSTVVIVVAKVLTAQFFRQFVSSHFTFCCEAETTIFKI